MSPSGPVETPRDRHYTQTVDFSTNNLQVMEPEKCEEWRWVSWEDLVSLYEEHNQAETESKMASFEGKVLFTPLVNLFRQRSGLHPWESYKQTV